MSKPVLLLFVLYIAWLFFNETRRREGTSWSLWVVVAWIAIQGSRPISAWFESVTDVTTAQAYDEGSPLERTIYSTLIVYGLCVLFHRGVRWRTVIVSNAAIWIFFTYWGLSVLWADAPLISAKRWFKDAGNIVMVLVILTEARPLEAMKAAFVRAAYLLLPLSLMFIHFVPGFGRTYHVWTGEMMFTGVTTHKNSLGVLALVSLFFLIWDFSSRSPRTKGPRSTLILMWEFLGPTRLATAALTSESRNGSLLSRGGELSLIGMTLWLLIKSASATALGCFAVGAMLLLAMSWKQLRLRVWWIEFFGAVAAISLWASGNAQALLNYLVVDVFGRDPTLTTRTSIWPMLISKVDSPFVGPGFDGFWTGERLAEVYAQLEIIQAHNGYLETFLNGGWIGLALLGMLLISALRHANRQLMEGSELARVAFAVIVVVLVHNLTEASFNKTSLVWFAFLTVVVRYPRQREVSLAKPKPAHRSSAPPLNQPQIPY